MTCDNPSRAASAAANLEWRPSQLFTEAVMRIKTWLPLLLASAIGVLCAAQWLAPQTAPARGGSSKGAVLRGASSDAASGSKEVWSGAASPFGPTGSTVATLDSDDPAFAFDAALRLPAGPERLAAIQTAFNSWIVRSPQDALAAINSVPAVDREEILTRGLAKLAEQRPDDFLHHAAGLANARDYVAGAMSVLAATHPKLALALVRREGADPSGALFDSLLPDLIRNDVKLAAQAVSEMGSSATSAHIQQVAAAYAKQDLKQAYEWADTVRAARTDLPARQLLNEITSSFVASDPAEASRFLGQATDPNVRKSLLTEIAARKSQDDLTGAVTWLSGYSNDASFSQSAVDLLYRWSYAKPDEVARVLPAVSNPEVQAAAAAHLARFWQARDPQAYQAWVATLPPGAVRDSVLRAH